MIGQPQETQSETVRQPKRWPLVQQFYTRSPDLPLTKDARLVNGFAEKDPSDGVYWIFKRVGVGSVPLYPSSGYPNGTYYYQKLDQLLSVVSNSLYSNGVLIGTMTPANGGLQCWFETVNSNPQTIVVMNGVEAWIYTPSTGAFVQIVDVSFPAVTVPGWAYLDGTLYVMDYFGAIWGSLGQDNAIAWDALNKIKASSKADGGVFLSTQLSYIVAFKQWTTQIFYDASNPTGSPLGPVPDAQIPYGCLTPLSVQKIDEILIWMTSNQTISPQIILMENLTPRVISTPSVERLLDNIILNINQPSAGDSVVFYSWSFKHAGHRFYGFSFQTFDTTSGFLTLVYDLDSGLWHPWTSPFGGVWPMTNFVYRAPTIGLPGLHYAQSIQGPPPPGFTGLPIVQGALYEIDGDYSIPNDLGLLFPVDIYTPNFTGGTPRRKTLNMMYFEGDQTSGSTLQARYTDDDYKSWSNFRSIDMSEVRPQLDQEGTFTKRAYHFRHMCNTRFRVKSTSIQYDLGTL